MKPVTDPSLLRQLNGPVKDEAILSQLEGTSVDKPLPSHPALPDRYPESLAERDLPELQTSGLLSGEEGGFGTASAILTTTDPTEISKIIRTQYPHIKQQQQKDASGNVFEMLYNPKNNVQMVVNKPNLSKLDLLQGLGLMSAFSPAASAATIGTQGAKAGFGMMGRRMAQGGAAAAGTESIIQGVQAATGGDFDAGQIALAGGLGGLSEMVGPGFNMLKANRQAKALNTEREAIDEVLGEVSKADKVAKETGVGFFPAQKTLDPFAIEEQSFVATLPAAARKARVKINTQNKQVDNAVNSFLDKLSSPESVETAASDVRDIAEQSITNAKLARSEQVSPLFNKVWSQKKVIPVDDIVKNLDDEIKNYGPGKIQNLLKQVKSSVEGSAKPVDGSNLRRLHNLKREIYAKISGFEKDAPLDGEIKAKLKSLYGDVVEKLKKNAPGYEEALTKYISETPGVEGLSKGVIGKISKTKDINLKSVSGTIFDQAESNPSIMRKTKNVIKAQSPEAWDAILRVEAQKRLKNIDLNVEKLTPDNAPAKIHSALFGSGNKRRIFLESMSKEQRKNALFLEEALKRAAQGRPGGSQTGIREVVKDKIKGVGLAIRRFLASPIQRAISTGEESAFNRNAAKMGDLLFDTKWAPKLTEIRQSKDIPAAIKAMSQLLKEE